jgi:hypothetical protein
MESRDSLLELHRGWLTLAKAPQCNAETILRRGPIQWSAFPWRQRERLPIDVDCFGQCGVVPKFLAKRIEIVGLIEGVAPGECSVPSLSDDGPMRQLGFRNTSNLSRTRYYGVELKA